jgi:DNA-binding response OmpR family regulator
MENKKIMIVDNDKEFLEELNEILILHGFYTIKVRDGTGALNAAKTQRPDLILLNLKLDGMNGFQIADRLKRIQATAHIPIIGISGILFKIKNSLDYNFFLMDFCSMFHKPFNPFELIDKIDEILLKNSDQSPKKLEKKIS